MNTETNTVRSKLSTDSPEDMKGGELVSIASWARRGVTFLISCCLTLGALQARAEHYEVQDQILVAGTQVPDPGNPDGQHFVRSGCIGTSTFLGLFTETSTCVSKVLTGPNGARTVGVSGNGVIVCVNGDKIFYRFEGAVTMSGSAGPRTAYAQVNKCKVTVTGGTGLFLGAWGSGQTTCLVTATDGGFTSRTDLTLCIVGEK